MKKRRLFVLIIILILSLIPVPMTLEDGGTKTYTAVLYKIIVWNKIIDDSSNGYKTGTEIYFFPNNLKILDEYK